MKYAFIHQYCKKPGQRLSYPHKIMIKNNRLLNIDQNTRKKARHCEGVKRLKQSSEALTAFEIAASTLKNDYFSVFPRNDWIYQICGDPSGSDPLMGCDKKDRSDLFCSFLKIVK